MKNIIFINAFASSSVYGGAVHVNSDNNEFIDLVFKGNKAGAGGGIFLLNSKYNNIINCSFDSNTASSSSMGRGGAIALFENSSFSEIKNCFFTNSKSTTSGSAIYISDISMNVGVFDCIFNNNIATNYGSAISTDGKFTYIYRCSFKGNKNTANTFGGTVNIWGEGTEIINSTFNNNNNYDGGAISLAGQSKNVFVENSTFENNAARNDGGGIFVNNGGGNKFNKLTFIGNTAKIGGAIHFQATNNNNITNSIFINNRISFERGGAVALYGGCSNCNIINNTFINNRAYTSGGAIYASRNSNYLYIYNITCNGNIATNYGSAVSSDGKYTIIANSTFTENTNKGNKFGGTVNYWDDGSKIYNSSFYNNNNYNGGAVLISDAGKNAVVENCVFVGNTARNYGGAICTLTQSNTIDVFNCTFLDNVARVNGGALSLFGRDSQVYDCNIQGGYAPDGGAIYWQGNNGVAYNLIVNNCVSVYLGGGICWIGVNGKLFNSTLSNNVVSKSAGALYVHNTASNMYVENVTFINNTVTRYGSAVSSNAFNTTIFKSLFINNSNIGNNYGGTVNFWGSESKILNSEFINNNAYYGGAVLISNTGKNILISNSVFHNNTARVSGGAVEGYGDPNSVTIINSTFIHNVASNYGGAMSINGLNSFITNCTFIENKGKYGGAVSLNSHSQITYSNFVNNTATLGGAISMGVLTTLIGSNFTNNNASDYGGSIHIRGNNVLINLSNFNQSISNFGGAVYITSQNVIIYQSNFTDNAARSIAGAIYVNGQNTIINSSNFNNNSARTFAGAVYINLKTTLDSSNFTANTVNNGQGGAVYIVGSNSIISKGVYTNNSANRGGAVTVAVNNAVINGSEFYNNSAVYGGAVFWNGLYGNLLNAQFMRNNASYGAAVYSNRENLYIKYSNFTNNTASIQAGAVYILKSNNIINSSNFKYNDAFSGGALYIYGDLNKVDLCNFTSNHADYGAGFYLVNTFNLTNSNFTSNVAREMGGAGYTFILMSRYEGDNIFTFWNDVTHTDDLYASFVRLINDTIFVGQNVTLNHTIPEYRGYITLLIDGQVFNTEIIPGTANTLNGIVNSLPSGVYDHIYAVYHSDDDFNNSYALVSLNVKRLPVTVSLIDNVTEIGGSIRVRVNETSATGNITVIFDGGYEYRGEITENGIATIQLDDYILSGDYNVTLRYEGDFNYDVAENISSIHINKVDYVPKLLFNWTFIGGDVVILLPDDVTMGNVNFTINGQKYVNEISGSSVSFTLNTTISANSYPILMEYSGDEKYNPLNNSTTFEVRKYLTDIALESNVTEVKSELFFIVSSDYDGGKITGDVKFTIDGREFKGTLTEDESGGARYAKISINPLVGGKYENVTVSFTSTNQNYGNTVKNFTFTLTKFDTAVTFEGPDDVEINKTLKFKVDPSQVTGNVSFIIDGKLYYGTISSGVANINIQGLSKGVYNDILVSYNGDGYYKISNTTFTFKVKEYPKINLTISNIVYGQNATLKVNITPNDVTGNVIVYVNKTKKYEGSITSGLFDVILVDLQQGKYIVNLTYLGDDKHFKVSNSIDLTVIKANSSIEVNEIKNGVFNTTNVIIKFDITNKTTVSIVIVNKTGNIIYQNNNYTLNNFTIGNLSAGEYNITIINALSRNYNSYNVTESFNVIKANSNVVITEIKDGVFNTTNVTVKFDVTNKTTISVLVVKNGTAISVVNITDFKSNAFSIGNLTPGIYNITIYNAESANYNASQVSGLFEVVRASSFVNITEIINGVFNTVNATVKFDIVNQTTVKVIVYKNGTDVCVVNNTDFSGSIFTIGNLTPGIYNITIYNAESANYNASQVSGLFEVVRASSFVNITEIISGIYNTTNATVKFDITNKTTVKIIVYKNGTNICVFNRTNFSSSEFSIGNLTAGEYNITITNVANNNFTEFNATTLFTVYKASSFVNITEIISGIYNTTNATVKFNIVNRTDVKIVVIKDGTSIVVYTNNNFVDSKFSIGNLTAGVYNITITNAANDNYNDSTNSTLFTIHKASSNIKIVDVLNSTYNTTDVEISFNVNNRTSINIIITNSSGSIVYTTDDYNELKFKIKTLDADNYNITISNEESDNYNFSSDKASFTVFKADSKITIVNVTDGFHKIDPAIITIDVDNRTNVFYTVTTMGGQFVVSGNTSTNKILINDLNVGYYNIIVFNNESKNYNPSNATASFGIVKSYSKVNITDVIDGIVDVRNVTVKFNILARTIVTLIVKNSNGTVIYNNSNYTSYEFSIGNLTTGIYNISIYNIETDNAFPSNASALFKVVVPTTIPSEDISRGYNSPYDYKAIFTDEFGNILNNTNVSMIVDGKIYNLTTDENGVAYLNDTLAIGKHNILLVNPVSGENRTHIVTIVERLQENKDIVMDFCDGTYYSVRAYGDDAKPIAGVSVTITVNGVSYDVVTNADGYSVLKIRLNPKTYTITAEWKDYKINKIVVRQTLKAKSVKIKKSTNKFKYSASLKWSSGKPIVGKIINFKFKGKTYKAKTNKKGIAKITFNKKVLSKLKVGKNYKINVTYNHVDSGYTSVNSIVKKIKVKN